jgi:channel protein (hemolysin III family)
VQTHSIPGFFEPFSALSHLIGALVFGLLSIPLLGRGRGDARRIFFLSVFSFSCVLLLSMSGVYHMLDEGSTARAVLGRLDKAAIFVLIAGTHTPVQGFFFRGIARWGVLALMWLLAATGITLFSVFYDDLPRGLGTSVYLGLGWIAGTFGILVWRRYGTRQVWPLVAGGLTYSSGAILMGLGWPTLIPGIFGPHEVWHVAVLVALALHWTFVFKHAHLSMGPGPPPAPGRTLLAKER